MSGLQSVVVKEEHSFMERITHVEKSIEEMVGKIGKIYDALLGNEQFDQQGIISRVKKTEEEIEKIKTFKNKLIGAFFVGGGISTIVWEIIKYILNR